MPKLLAVGFQVATQALQPLKYHRGCRKSRTSPAEARKERKSSSIMNVAQPIEWTSKGVVILDQRRLPGEVIRHTYTDYRDVAASIKDMVIRGAPAIGVAAAMGVALGVERSGARTL